ncbi:MAG: ComF family protein [Berkelbacteria bacterium GW2011_GWA2_35_9]|uniref:ComF family protein n=1 Tax=Berkelbacteria bacterium GW2011_GWA2_35_9 TaxID=1618333 RepID=A0A0G0D0D3_9BACT|nr:MAG: ComF family protein [Berkelbacteria bacterium GW2011_GWA2_35_9]
MSKSWNSYWLKNYLLDLLFPKYCIICQKIGWNYLCLECLSKVRIERNIHCPDFRCKRIVRFGNYCIQHRRKSKALTGVLSLSNYKNRVTKELIHYLKYEGVKELVGEINKLDLSKIKEQIITKNSVLIPVPLFRRRENNRGYNQSLEIARIFSESFKLPIENGIIRRSRNTKSQMQIEQDSDRVKNIKNAFGINDRCAHKLKNKTVYLVDDVMTSGATLQELAKTLKQLKYPPRRIYGLVLAKR